MIAEQGVLFQLWIVEDLLCKHHKSVPENTLFQCRKIQIFIFKHHKSAPENTLFHLNAWLGSQLRELKINGDWEVAANWRKKCTVERVKDCFDGIPPISFSFLLLIIKC